MALFKSIRGSYEKLITTCGFLQHLFLLVVRLYWGYAFQLAGLSKFANINETADGFAQIGIPLAHLMVYIVAGVEYGGGWCLIAGFASRFASLFLSFVMVVALFTAHLAETSLALIDPGKFTVAAPLTYLLISLVVLVFGPGCISIDYLIERLFFRKKNKIE